MKTLLPIILLAALLTGCATKQEPIDPTIPPMFDLNALKAEGMFPKPGYHFDIETGAWLKNFSQTNQTPK